MRVHGNGNGLLAWHKNLTPSAFNLNYYEYNKKFSTTQLLQATSTSTMMTADHHQISNCFYKNMTYTNPNPSFNPKIY